MHPFTDGLFVVAAMDPYSHLRGARLLAIGDTDAMDVLGISFDTQREDMNQFRQANGVNWPTSFSGRMLWEDPIGRLYQASAPGTFYVINRQGRLDGIFTDTTLLAERIGELLPPGTPRRAQSQP